MHCIVARSRIAINRGRKAGLAVFDAVVAAGVRRLRPILLTSFTTFFGLAPMILETSLQARILIPMAISLGFGILFATGIVLCLVPALFLVMEDLRGVYRAIRGEPSVRQIVGTARTFELTENARPNVEEEPWIDRGESADPAPNLAPSQSENNERPEDISPPAWPDRSSMLPS